MPYTEHYKRYLTEQIEVLIAHHARGGAPDYAFIREHAEAIVQICDHAQTLRMRHDFATVRRMGSGASQG